MAELARYHAERFQSAQDYQFFVRTGERQCLLDAIGHYRKAVDHWDALGRLTDGVYYDHMVFNRPPEQVGHWKDELPFLKVDLARLEEIDRTFVENSEHPKSAEKWQIENPQSKMTLQWKEEQGVVTRWADIALKPAAAEDFPDRYSMRHPRLVVKNLFNDFRYSKILHAPVRSMDAGRASQRACLPAGPPRRCEFNAALPAGGARLSFQFRRDGGAREEHLHGVPARREGGGHLRLLHRRGG